MADCDPAIEPRRQIGLKRVGSRVAEGALPVKKDLHKVRNAGIMAHIDVGKTTTTGRILHYTGINRKVGETHDGASTTDWMGQEKERGITITFAAVACFWNDNQINIIDTSGHVDFTVEVERSLRMLGGAVAVFDDKEGVEPQSEQVWCQTQKYDVPRICFVNKMNKLGIDFYYIAGTIIDHLSIKPLVMQLPIGAENDFDDVVDLLEMRALMWPGKVEIGTPTQAEEIPADMVDRVDEYREKFIETAAKSDEELMERYFGGEELTMDEIKGTIHRLVLSSETYPVYCGTAYKNKGVEPLLDTAIDFLPNPLDIGEVHDRQVGDEDTDMVRKPSKGEPFSTLAFKIAARPFFGKLTFTRVCSGRVEPGQQVLNSTKDKKERVDKLFQMHANKENPIDEAVAGNIYAFVGLKDTTTNDTLCAQDAPIILESMSFPDPTASVAIEPKSKTDQEELSTAIQRLAEEDPTFTVRLGEETDQTVIGDMDELHLDVLADRMEREFRVETNIDSPQVAYRETIRKPIEKFEYTHKKQAGSSGWFTRVIIALEPYTPSTDEIEEDESTAYRFVSEVTGGRVPRRYISSVDADIQDAIQYGTLAGYPLVNIRATLLDGVHHEVDSSEMAFKIAGRQALREAVRKARPVPLEPMMAVEVITPEEYMGEVIGDISSRRGQIDSMEGRTGVKAVKALVLPSEVFGYVGDLRFKTQGHANYTMIPSSYAEVPSSVTEGIIAARTDA